MIRDSKAADELERFPLTLPIGAPTRIKYLLQGLAETHVAVARGNVGDARRAAIWTVRWAKSIRLFDPGY